MATAIKSVKNAANSQVSPIPQGFGTVTPYLLVDNVEEFIRFAEQAFGAETAYAMKKPDGTIGHCELDLGTSKIMAGCACTGMEAAPVSLYLYVADVDATYKKATAAGATSKQEPKDMFYGDRTATVTDKCGNTWWIATHVEDVPEAELERRAKEQWAHKNA